MGVILNHDKVAAASMSDTAIPEAKSEREQRIADSICALAERVSTFERKCPQALVENYLKPHDTSTGRGFDLAHAAYILYTCQDVIAKQLAETEYTEGLVAEDGGIKVIAKVQPYMGTVADREALEAIVFKDVGDFYTVKSYRTDDIDDKGENIVLNDVNFVWDGFSWIRKD